MDNTEHMSRTEAWLAERREREAAQRAQVTIPRSSTPFALENHARPQGAQPKGRLARYVALGTCFVLALMALTVTVTLRVVQRPAPESRGVCAAKLGP